MAPDLDDAARCLGVARGRQRNCWAKRDKWQALSASATNALVSALICIFILSGCHRTKLRSPEDIDTEIVAKIHNNQFDDALHQADQASRDYAQRDSRWYWQFQIWAARAQLYRGQYNDVIERLKPPLPAEFAHGDMAAIRKMTLAYAEAATQQFRSAKADIADAEQLAIASSPSIQMQVLQTRADIEFDNKEYIESEASLRRALELARAQGSQVTEATVQGGLGNAAMGQEHFDEAIDHYNASLDLAKRTGKNFSVPLTLGNLGWSYDALGDYANAEESFKQAEQQAHQAEQAADRISWLSNLANVYRETREYAKAESTANQALTLATDLGDPHTTVQCLNSLTDIALDTDRLEQAEQLNRRAQKLEGTGFDQQ